MKIDKFTKVVLAIIAINLSVLTIQKFDVFPKAHAETTIQDFGITNSQNYGLVPLNADGSITVKLSPNEELDVNIVGVDTYDELDVNIDEVGGGYVSHGGPITVEIDD